MNNNPLLLADWRRTVAEMYAQVRQDSIYNPVHAWKVWRQKRDTLFKHHPLSPLDEVQKEIFGGLCYYPYDPAWRVVGNVAPVAANERTLLTVDLGDDGTFAYRRVAQVAFTVNFVAFVLNVYWIEGYGGGLFLPFKDLTNGAETYGNGRYLFDTIKGADLGSSEQSLTLDFNFAYNPSCSYNGRWVCPLSPAENRLLFPVTAGEKVLQMSNDE